MDKVEFKLENNLAEVIVWIENKKILCLTCLFGVCFYFWLQSIVKINPE